MNCALDKPQTLGKQNTAFNKAQKLNKGLVAKHFSAASNDYDRYAKVQKQIAEFNLELLHDSISCKAKQAVDLGCGTGLHTKSIADLSKNCLAIDISHGMLAVARTHNSQTKTAQGNEIRYCTGDADNLPLHSNSIDLLHSSMALQWCSSPKKAIEEIVRVLSRQGSAQLAIMLDSSLFELKNAWKSIELEPRVNEFFSKEEWLHAMHDLVTKLNSSDLNTQLSVKHQSGTFVEWHSSSLQMLRALKRVGAATKSELEGHAERCNDPLAMDGVQEHKLPNLNSISKTELRLLDQEMQKQLEQNFANCVDANQTKEKKLVGRLPLSYQVLFLTIQKNKA